MSMYDYVNVKDCRLYLLKFFLIKMGIVYCWVYRNMILCYRIIKLLWGKSFLIGF